MKAIRLTKQELSMVEKALRWYISDLQRDINRHLVEGDKPVKLQQELDEWKALKSKFE